MPSIATNVAANSSLFYLNRNSANQSSSLSKISSGSRIVKASDDAAGSAIAAQISADISSLSASAQTIQQADALLQVADGGLQRIGDILQRIKALAAQYDSGTLDAASQGFVEAEYDQLKTTIDSVVATTQYNGSALLDGTFTGTIIVGVDATDTFSITLAAVDVDVAGLALAANFTNAATDFPLIDAAITEVGTARALVGSYQSGVGFQGENIATQIENLQNARGSITDVDIAAEQTRFTNFQVLTEAAIAGLAQANQITQSLLSLLR